ncbi:MAG: oligosaccharide flippase family protein, partial [Epsilonproteobacteria bacterium]|nr:oligosaccharide flippase family protein [Campylobacterota bacterium]
MSKKQAIKSLSFLWMGSLLGSGSTFVIYMILARELGSEQFGIFSSALATAAVLSILAGFGISQAWLKHFGKEGWQALRWLPSSFKLISYSVVFVLAILFIWAYFGPHDEVTKNILFVLSLFIIGQMIIELISVKLQLEEKYPMLALWQLSPNLSRLVFIASLVYLFSISLEVTQIAFIYAGIAVIFIVIGIYQLYQMSQNKFDLKGHGEKKAVETTTPDTKETFSHSWAFGLGSFFAFIYVQSDIIMLKYIAGDEQAGLYNVGFILLTAIYLFPSALYQKFL